MAREAKLAERTGAGRRLLGLGLLMATVVLAALDTSAPAVRAAQEPSFEGLRLSRLGDTFPSYPGATLTPMGMLDANSNAMEMGYFETRDAPGDVLGHFGREFERRGHQVEYVGEEGEGTVSYYDNSLGLLVAVHAMPSGEAHDRRTLVFPSIVEAQDGISLTAAPLEAVPSPAGATAVLRLDDRGAGSSGGGRTMTLVAPGTPDALATFYLEALPVRGFKSTSSKSEQGGARVLHFEQEAQRLSVMISPLAGESGPESAIAIILEGE